MRFQGKPGISQFHPSVPDDFAYRGEKKILVRVIFTANGIDQKILAMGAKRS